MSNFISNAFMMPNDLIDKGYMAKMKGAALPCYLFIVRKTRGWNKSADNISTSQLVEATGYKKDAVLTGIELLIEMGIVEKVSFQNRPSKYTLTDNIVAVGNSYSDNSASGKTDTNPKSAVGNTDTAVGNSDSNLSEIPTHNNNIKTTNTKTREGASENPRVPEKQNSESEENSVERTLKIWTPNLDDLNSWLQRSGLPKINQAQAEEILLEVNPHYENKIHTGAVTDSQMYSNFVKWVKRDTKLTEKLFEQAAKTLLAQEPNLGFSLPEKPKGFLGGQNA